MVFVRAENSSLVHAIVPEGVAILDIGCFRDNENLTSVVIPESVTTISESAFSGCTKLASVAFPDSLTTIDDWAFYNCPSLQALELPPNMTFISTNPAINCICHTQIGTTTAKTLGNRGFIDPDYPNVRIKYENGYWYASAANEDIILLSG